MTDADSLVNQIHAAPGRIVLAVTGGGSGALAQLLTVSGASRTVLEAVVPYSEAALTLFLGAKPEHACDPRTARAMAMAAFQRGLRFRAFDHSADYPVIGVGCTASLASDRPKQGPHRFHVAWQTIDSTIGNSIELVKGKRSRAAEEAVVAAVVLNAIAKAKGLDARIATGLDDDEPVTRQRAVAEPAWQSLLLGAKQRVCVDHGKTAESGASPRAVFPGAFNPLHQGHRRMADVAARILNCPVDFELSIENVDKPPLDYWEIRQRTAPLADRVLWLTRAPTFARKAKLFPGATFVVGADTLVRIAEPRYYGGEAACRAAIAQIAALGCRFLVFGRAHQGRFETLDELPLVDELRAICTGVPEADFREDISSTELRRPM